MVSKDVLVDNLYVNFTLRYQLSEQLQVRMYEPLYREYTVGVRDSMWRSRLDSCRQLYSQIKIPLLEQLEEGGFHAH